MADLVGIEHHYVCRLGLGQCASVGDAEHLGGALGEHVDGGLEVEAGTCAHERLQELRRVLGIAQLAGVRSRIGQPDHRGRVVQQLVDVVGIVIDHILSDAHLKVGFERDVEHPVHGILTRLVGHLLHVAALELGVVGQEADLGACPAIADLAAVAGLLLELSPPLCIGVVALAAFEVALGHRGEAAQGLIDEGCLPTHFELDGLDGHLREHRQASLGDLMGAFQLGAVASRASCGAQQRCPADVRPCRLGDACEFVMVEAPADRGLHDASDVAERLSDLDDLVGGCGAARHGTSLVADVGGCLGGSESQCAGSQCLRDQIALRSNLFGSAFALGGLFAHDIHASGGVPNESGRVHRGTVGLERIEVLREGLKAPVAQAGAQRVDAHALHVLERAHDEVAVFGPGGRDRESAVAHHDGGDAVPRRTAHQPVPHDLRVVVRVDVDESRTDDAPGGVDGLGSFGGSRTERHHLAVRDADIADEAG